MSKELTIIIVTNRINCLNRILEYWLTSPYKILIADGSDSSNKEKFLNSERVIYFWDSGKSITNRVIKALKLVTTEYSLLVDDEDFFYFPGIEKCIDFLNRNDDYNAACGWFYGFYKDELVLKPRYVGLFDHNYYGNTSGERFYRCMKNYFQTLYSVFRTKKTLEILNRMGSHDYKELIFYELVVSISIFLTGNVIYLPIVYSARENHEIGFEKYWYELDVVRRTRYICNNGYISFEKAIIDTIKFIDDENHAVVEKKVKKGIEAYCRALSIKGRMDEIRKRTVVRKKVLVFLCGIKRKFFSDNDKTIQQIRRNGWRCEMLALFL